MKKIVFTILTLIIIMVGMTNSLASGDITPFAVRDPNDVKPLPYEGSGKTSGTMSPALRAPSDGKITRIALLLENLPATRTQQNRQAK